MASTATVIYTGNFHTDATHNQSGTVISTDAPTDNGGKGEAFSPTDLVATALASCLLTIMAFKAKSLGVEFSDVRAEATKVMAANPRRIASIKVEIFVNHRYPKDVRESLEHAAHGCPVGKSLREDLEEILIFHYPDED